ncbi:hypothetical protein KSS87_022399 [Heliosperma pusillum]|nr:hypothetical protein KSS87_022399 [Heliosperma pusillum]
MIDSYFHSNHKNNWTKPLSPESPEKVGSSVPFLSFFHTGMAASTAYSSLIFCSFSSSPRNTTTTKQPISKNNYNINNNTNPFISSSITNLPKLFTLLDKNKTHKCNYNYNYNYPCKSHISLALDSLFVLCTSLAVSLTLFVSDVDAFVVTTPRKLQTDELATVRLFQENTPSVVYITNLATKQDMFTLDVFEVPQGSGSGFVWDKKGHIVTNYHVIRGASDLRVTLADQSTFEAKIVGYDQDKDVAVLAIDAPKDKLRPIPIGVSADLLVGQKVFAIGNPFGLDHTLTTGVISYIATEDLALTTLLDPSNLAVYPAVKIKGLTNEISCSGLRREISSAATGRPIQDVIQTDAAINPGNSGGPLLDSSGSLIGINTAIYSPSGASSGVGFSIPVDTVGGIVDQIVQFGKVTRPILGIKFAPDQSVEQLGVSGVLVLDAPPDGPAGKAGLLPTKRDGYGRLVLGDIITSINGKKVSNGSDLYRILDSCKVGDKVIVEVLRGDHQEKIPVTLEPKPDES